MEVGVEMYQAHALTWPHIFADHLCRPKSDAAMIDTRKFSHATPMIQGSQHYWARKPSMDGEKRDRTSPPKKQALKDFTIDL
jgi:hypothetical protein